MSPRSERHVIGYLAFMGILLAFGIDTALPAYDELRAAFDLEPDSNRITLIVTLYFFGMAAGQLVYGPLSDRFGRVAALRAGLLLYCLGALGSIVAPSLEALLASRLVWGLGAAAPGVLRAAIARDLYAGNQMARVISVMMGVFMLGPVLAPMVGAGILHISSWEWVFASALVLAGVLFVWSFRFGETLDPANRRPFDFGATASGFRLVFSTQVTLAYTLALTFGFGGFIVFLGSAQPVIDNIYGREDQFVFWFAAAGVLMAVMFFNINRFIDRRGAHRVALGVTVVTVTLSSVLLVVALLQDGRPSFGVWLVLIGLANAFTTMLTPTCFALGLEPMGALAGTASAVMGFVSTAGGSALAAIVDAAIQDTVTPMATGYVVYGSLALCCLLWAGAAASAAHVTPGPEQASASRTPPS